MRNEGRYYFVFFLLFFYLIFVVALLGYNFNIMKFIGVPVWNPSFADLRVIMSGLDCKRLGYDPLIYNPCDPWKRPMNYPRIWQFLELFGIKQEHTFNLGIILAICFYLSVFKFLEKINKNESIIYSLIIFSPAFLLAIERGNNDLIIFIILSLSIIFFIENKFLFYSSLLFCSLIKLFPFFGLISVFKEQKRHFFSIGCIISLIFGIYIFSHLDELILIFKATPKPISNYCYGSMVFIERLAIVIKNIFKIDIRIRYLFTLFWTLTYSFIIIAIIIFKRIKIEFNPEHISSFRIGAGIYIGTFLMGYNWEYRLIFIIFSLPQILGWLKVKNSIRFFSFAALISIILICWVDFWKKPFVHFPSIVYLIRDSLAWLLFVSFTFMLFKTLPEWAKLYTLRNKLWEDFEIRSKDLLLSIIMPSWDEPSHIPKTLRAIKQTLDKENI